MQEVERKCIVSGEVKEKIELLRFVEVDGLVIPDFGKKLSGRGVYVTNSAAVLAKAVDKKMFSKAFKKKVVETEELLETVEKILKKKGLESINIARKGGVLVAGFEKVKEAIVKNKVAFLLEAKDAGEDGRKKMSGLAKNLKIFSLYETEELDKALDKVNTVHIALMKSKLADAVYNDLQRLENFFNKTGN